MTSYKGYEICDSNPTGGKAGKGKNITATIQIRDHNMSGGYLLKKQIRYTINKSDDRKKAIKKAREYIDKNLFWGVL